MSGPSSATRSPRAPKASWGPVAYVGLLCAVFVLLAGVAWVAEPATGGVWWTVLFLWGLGAVSVLTRERTAASVSISFSAVVLLTSIALVPPVAAGALGVLIAGVDRRYWGTRPGLFNAAMMGLAALAGAWSYQLAGGSTDLWGRVGTVDLLLHVGLPMLAADLACFLVNAALVSAMVRVDGGHGAMLGRGWRQLVPLYVGYGVVAFLFVILWGPARLGPLSVILMAAPLTLVRFVYVQYGDERRVRRRVEQTLVRALDDAEGSLAARAGRIRLLCDWTATELGLPAAQRRVLARAALLHDIGMKGVTRALQHGEVGSGRLGDLGAVLPHPELAERLLLDVDYLADAAPVIRAHHERVDGRGYPDGLVGDEIPLEARILAAADAFEALTTTCGARGALDRDAAVGALREVAGSQLDPDVVDALTAALAGREWETRAVLERPELWVWEHHALPVMSEIMADELAADAAAEDRWGAVSLGATGTDGEPLPAPAGWQSLSQELTQGVAERLRASFGRGVASPNPEEPPSPNPPTWPGELR